MMILIMKITKEIISDSRLIGLSLDDAIEYVDWIRRSINSIDAHIPYYA